MDLLELKLLMMGVMFFSTTLVGIAPILLKGVCGARISGVLSAPTRARMLSCASCFSAGVFLFVCFMGLLPAADSKFHLILQRLEEDGNLERFSEFPWGFFIVTCGFLVIFTIDKLVHAFEVSRRKSKEEDTSSKSSTSGRSSSSSSSPVSDVTLLSIKGTPTPNTSPIHLTDPSFEPNNTPPSIEEYVANTLKKSQNKEMLKQRNANIQYAASGARRDSKTEEDKSVDFQLQISQQHGHRHQQGKGGVATDACVILERSDSSSGHGVPSSLIFLVALGIHSMFEGAAVGLQTEQEKVLEFGVAVLVHEIVMAFTFGLEVSRSKRLTWMWQMVYVGLFTVCIPLGIAVGAGTLHNTNTENREVVAAVLEAIATGIFLHVIFIEILAKEFPEHHHNHEHHHHISNNNNNNNNPSHDHHKHHHNEHHNNQHHNNQHHNNQHHNNEQQNHDPQQANYQSISVSDTEDELGHGRQSSRILTIGPVGRDASPQNKSAAHASGSPSEVRLIIEKIASICAGLLTLILLNVFMYSHH